MGGWIDHRTGLDAVVKRKIPSFRRESNPSAILTELSSFTGIM
jgi:hypothetical protein